MEADRGALAAPETALDPRVVVLVEGPSDAVVVTALVSALLSADVSVLPEVDRDADLEIVSMDGITNVRHHLRRVSAEHPQAVVLGLYDRAEERFVRRALEALGRTVDPRPGLQAQGFHRCDADLEEELIRALGSAVVEEALDEIGDLARFRTFQHQPEWRGRDVRDQLHRFAGSGSGRKAALAGVLARRLDPGNTPAPLSALAQDIAAALRAG